MKKWNQQLLILSLVLSFHANSQSFDVCNTQSNELSSIKNHMTEVGQAKLKVWFWNVYNSVLYTPSGKYSTDSQCLIFEINYLMDISKADLINSTVENWQHLGISETSYQPFIKSLKRIWPDVNKGDQIALKINADNSTFYLNGENIGSIKSSQFGSLFLSIWLSKNTTQPKLRKQLIGANS